MSALTQKDPSPGSRQLCSGRLGGDAQPFRGLAQALLEAQQSEANERRTRNEKRCEVDGIRCPNRLTGKRLTGAIDYLGRKSQDLPMRSSRGEVRSAVGDFGLRQVTRSHSIRVRSEATSSACS